MHCVLHRPILIFYNVHTHKIFICGIILMPFVLYLCGISFSNGIRCRHTWLPTDLSLLPALFPSLPSPCLPSSPTGHPEDSFFCQILKNECIISLACQASPGPPPAIPTPTLQGTFPCSRLRSCSHASNASLPKMNCKGHGSCSSFC